MTDVRIGPWNPCSSGAISMRTGSTPKPGRYRFAAILNWKQTAFCALSMAILAFPCRAQKGGYPGSTGPNHGAVGGAVMSGRYKNVPISSSHTESKTLPMFSEDSHPLLREGLTRAPTAAMQDALSAGSAAH